MKNDYKRRREKSMLLTFVDYAVDIALGGGSDEDMTLKVSGILSSSNLCILFSLFQCPFPCRQEELAVMKFRKHECGEY